MANELLLLGIGYSGLSNWTPAELGVDLRLWLDANDASTITLNGSTVVQWNDKSIYGHHLDQATASLQPTYIAVDSHGKPAIQNTSADYLSRASSSVFQDVGVGNIFAVCNYSTNAVGANGMLATCTAPFTGTRMGLTPNPSVSTANQLGIGYRRLDTDGYLSVSSSTSRASVQTTWILEQGTMQWASATAEHYTNAVQDFSGAAGTAGNTSNTASGLGVFNRIGGGIQISDGTEVSEILMIHGALSTDTRQLIEGYLAWKWSNLI